VYYNKLKLKNNASPLGGVISIAKINRGFGSG